jgi:AcrR family transcriptional regulator
MSASLATSRTKSRTNRIRPRLGGRSARVVESVLHTTLEVLGQQGYAQLRIEDIAARAGVNKTTIYRRWPTRSRLVMAALTTLAAPPTAVETGRLEADLTTTFLSATTLRSTPAGRGVVRALIAERGDPEVDEVVHELRELHRAPARQLLEQARRRGDLPRSADTELLLDVLTGTVYSRLRERPEPLDPQWVRRVVRLVLSGAATGARARDSLVTGKA